MTIDRPFSDELAFSVAKFTSYERGKEYFKDGYVEKIWKEGEEYRAVVRGANLYKISLKFEDEELIYSCSCPFELEGACKHVVAAILAFASDKKFTSQPIQKRVEKNKTVINELLSKMSTSQQRLFLEKALKKDPSLIEDLKIFLQGTQQTPITISDYKIQFRNELDQLDLRELLQMWYQEGEDYYDDQYDNFTSPSLEDLIDEFTASGQKYEENKNYGEALKIYQAIFEALDEKQQTLHGDFSELSDWFGQEMDKVIALYIKTLGTVDSKNLKEIGIDFLCSIFQQASIYINKGQILAGLKQTIISKDEANYTLGHLGFKEKVNLSAEESTFLAFLYFLAEDWLTFEDISLKNLKENPSLTLDLLRYYQKNNNKDKIIQTANKILDTLEKKNKDNDSFFSLRQLYDSKEVEIQIRHFLKNVLSSPEDYPLRIANAERLFLITGELTDYKELVSNYHDKSEKEKFWIVIKKHFADEYEVKIVFKVFKLENQKKEILELIIKYPQTDCFPDMISFVQKDFPEQCFTNYKKKIEAILKETNVEKYKEVAYHLKRMKQIDNIQEFNIFLRWIKETYWRRRRLLEELRDV